MLNYTVEILSVNPFPIKLNMCDSINCPICDSNLTDEYDINLDDFEFDDDTSILCKNCDTLIKFKIKKI